MRQTDAVPSVCVFFFYFFFVEWLLCDAVIDLFNLSIPLSLFKKKISFKFSRSFLSFKKKKKKRASASSVRRCSNTASHAQIHFTAFIMYSMHRQLYIATLELFAIRTKVSWGSRWSGERYSPIVRYIGASLHTSIRL